MPDFRPTQGQDAKMSLGLLLAAFVVVWIPTMYFAGRSAFLLGMYGFAAGMYHLAAFAGLQALLFFLTWKIFRS